MKLHEAVSRDVIRLPNGELLKRCESTSPPHDSGQCLKAWFHIQEGDRIHSDGIIVWGANTTTPSSAPGTFYSTDTTNWLGVVGATPVNPTGRRGYEAEDALSHWWYDKAAAEIVLTVPKAIEYGSTDLTDIGLMLARTMRRTVNQEEAAELGVFFYLIGKIARWQSAIERGERPSDDTLLDIGVYVRMAQRIRDAGGWPGVDAPDGGSTLNREEQG